MWQFNYYHGNIFQVLACVVTYCFLVFRKMLVAPASKKGLQVTEFMDFKF